VGRAVIEIPATLLAERVRQSGETGRRWVAALPGLVRTLCGELGLELEDRPVRHGANAAVVDVRCDGEPCVLKVSWSAATASEEAAALRAWNGYGAVRLLAARAAEGALLLERLDAARTLRTVPLAEAAEIAGGLIRRLAVPAPAGLPRVRRFAAEVADTLAVRNAQLGSAIPDEWVATAAALERRLAAGAGTTLVHADLHYGNILAGLREPWLAVDPHAVAGDPELSVPELMWTRLDEIGDADGLQRVFDTVVGAGELDAARALAWVYVRAVDYWLWGLPLGLTDDPVRCRRLIELVQALPLWRRTC
jgi:streptomycin 6-kinase